jgi:hypothetical protein
MRQWIRLHVTYANVMATIAVFLALGLGGSALAATVINSNTQVAKDTISGHNPPSGKHANIIPGSINGKDIADRSGVDTCQTPLVAKFGPICAGSDGVARNWNDALQYCAGLGLRLPTLSEAVTLAQNYDVPGVATNDEFWANDTIIQAGSLYAGVSNETGAHGYAPSNQTHQTVCVTDPSA